MHPPGLRHHDAHRGEGVGAGAPQGARPGRVADVVRAAEHEHIAPGHIHGGEQAPPPFQAQPGEVDAATVLERHDTGHAATSKGS